MKLTLTLDITDTTTFADLADALRWLAVDFAADCQEGQKYAAQHPQKGMEDIVENNSGEVLGKWEITE